MSATMVGQRQKNLKLHQLKRPKTVTQKNKFWTIKYTIQNLIYRVYLLNSCFLAKKSQLLYVPRLTQSCTDILPQHSQKSIHFTNFPANMLLVGARKKHLLCNISKRPRTAFWKNWRMEANVCIFLYISIKKICLGDVKEAFIWLGAE